MNKEAQLVEQFSKRIARVVEALIEKKVREAKRRKFSRFAHKVGSIPSSILAASLDAIPTVESNIAGDGFTDCERDLE